VVEHSLYYHKAEGLSTMARVNDVSVYFKNINDSILASGSGTVVEHLPHDIKVEGLNPGATTGNGRIKITRIFGRILYWLVAVAQWYNTCLIILRSRVQVQLELAI
jgi:hypothetical protein